MGRIQIETASFSSLKENFDCTIESAEFLRDNQSIPTGLFDKSGEDDGLSLLKK